MSGVYLKFANLELAKAKMQEADFQVSQYNDSVIRETDGAWGTMFYIPGQIGYFCNLWDCECPESLLSYQIEKPTSPYNVRF